MLRELVLSHRGVGRPDRLVPGGAAAQARRRTDRLDGELAEGAALLGVEALTVEERARRGLDDRFGKSWSQTLEVDVDRTLARFGAWYELFPRSWGGFEGVRSVLPSLAELGFDVVYLPPIHPIGRSNRKGRNNALDAGPETLEVPGRLARPRAATTRSTRSSGRSRSSSARRGREGLGIEIALDFAIQCSPDHPWLKQHPEWFNRRPDGTLKYAENPPKKYQDIYNVNFESRGLARAVGGAVRRRSDRVERGVRVFRVDNPHTKPVAFWEWLIDEVRAQPPR